MNIELIGDLFLCIAILASGVLFTVANANYKPEDTKKQTKE